MTAHDAYLQPTTEELSASDLAALLRDLAVVRSTLDCLEVAAEEVLPAADAVERLSYWQQRIGQALAARTAAVIHP